METKEMIGYISRWCALALSMALVLAAATAVGRATPLMSHTDHPRLVISDGLIVGDETFNQLLLGLIDPHPLQWDERHVLVSDPAHHVSMVPMWSNGLPVRMTHLPVGRSSMSVSAVPYGREAFDRWRFNVLSLTGDERLFMVDARMADLSGPEPSPQMLSLLTDLKRRGIVVFVATGAGKDFAELRRRALTADNDAIVICSASHQWPVMALPGNFLKDTRLGELKGLVVITGNRTSAAQTTKESIRTYLVGQEKTDRPGPENPYLTSYQTLAELRSYIKRHPTN